MRSNKKLSMRYIEELNLKYWDTICRSRGISILITQVIVRIFDPNKQ